MDNYKVCLIKGDGIGPEIVDATVEVMDRVGELCGYHIEYDRALLGGEAIDATGEPLPRQTVDKCKASDAVFLGAVGGEKWDTLPGDQRPEAGLLGIRKELGLFANLRPAIMYRALKDASPLKNEILGDGLDVLVVRELTGGIYFGQRQLISEEDGYDWAYDTERYNTMEVERIARVAFEVASKRGKKLTSIDKANVLESSRLWRKTVVEVAKDYPEVELNHLYVDNAAMQLIRDPHQFDVIVTSNMFGDILSDEASMITGSLGMLPSASLGEGSFGLYEPIHGSAPDIAGQNLANPMATILSGAMMLRHSFGNEKGARMIEDAIESVLNQGLRTKDLTRQGDFLHTDQITQAILKELK